MTTGRRGTYGNTQTTTRERYDYRQTRNIREYTNNHKGKILLQADQEHTGIHKQPQGKDMTTDRPGTYGNTQTTTRERYDYRQTRNIREYTNNHKGKIWLQADQEHTGIHKQPQGKDMTTGRPGTYGNTQTTTRERYGYIQTRNIREYTNNHNGKIWLQTNQEHTEIHKQPQGKDMATDKPGTYGNTQTTTRERYGYRQTRNIREYTNNHKGKIWLYTSHRHVGNIPPIDMSAWTKESGGPRAVWTMLLPIPDACWELVSCGCKSPCSTPQCPCFRRKNFKCTYACPLM